MSKYNTKPSLNPPSDRVETLRVFAAADRGMAMGHIRGKVAFVPFAAPGDRVEVEVVREKRRHVETRLLRVLDPSPLRRRPRCPHFGACGGCQWQHLPYAAQLEAKAQSFRGFLKSRLGPDAPGAFRPPIAAPAEWGYRNRVGLKVRAVGNEVLVGFFAQGSHRLVPVAICPVAHPAICNLLAPLRDFLQGFPPARGFVPQVDLQIDGHDRPWAVLHLLRPLTGEQKRDLRAFFGANGAAGVHLQAGRKQTLAPLAGETVPPRMPFTVTAGDRELALDVTPGGFVQANPAVNQKLVDELVVLTPGYVGRPALDLYCGAGNFTLPLAVRASEVAGIEDYPPAARDAGANAGRNGLPRVRVLGEPARPGLATLAAEGFRPDFALLDPPREGAAEVVGPLADLAPEQILYVSCAPPTLARDLKAFTGRGYRIEWTRIADMFPQTAHVESLTLLRSPRA